MDVPEGRFFNPYYPSMIIGMPPQLHDGMIEYDDGTPASAPQMAHDVSEFLMYVADPHGPDRRVDLFIIAGVVLTVFPLLFMVNRYHAINSFSYREELYAIKNGGYKKFRDTMFKNTGNFNGSYS